jgi:WD40 repeat protein
MVHNGTVRYASFSREGHRVVTASEDHTGRVWDTRLGEALTPGLKHGTWGKVLHAAFSPDDNHVVTSSEDGTARVWTLGVNEQSVEALEREALILAGKKIDDKGRLVPLEAKDIHKAWTQRE